MTQNKKPEPEGAPDAPRSANVFDRFNDGLSENPKKYATWTVAIFVAILGSIVAVQYFRDSGAEEQDAAYRAVLRAGGTWSEAQSAGVEIDASRTSGEILAALGDVRDEAQGTEYAPYYYWLLSRAAFRAAEEENDAEKKLGLFRQAQAACETLISDYADTPWVKTPWKSSGNPEVVEPSLVHRRLVYCKAQSEFIEANRGDLASDMVPDEGVSITLTLKDANDAEAEPKVLKIEVFSEAAPYAVARLKANIDSGYWKGRHVYGLQENDENTPTNDGVLLGSPMSQSPWAWEQHGGEDDWVQCTLPLEPNRLNPDRGTVAFELHRDKAAISGASPTNLVIHTSDHARPRDGQGRVVFGKVAEESEETLAWLENLACDNEKRLSTPPSAGANYAPKLTLVISGVSIEGAPKTAPHTPLDLSHWKDPEQPEKTEGDKTDDGDKADDGKKADGGDKKQDK